MLFSVLEAFVYKLFQKISRLIVIWITAEMTQRGESWVLLLTLLTILSVNWKWLNILSILLPHLISSVSDQFGPCTLYICHTIVRIYLLLFLTPILVFNRNNKVVNNVAKSTAYYCKYLLIEIIWIVWLQSWLYENSGQKL